MSMFDGFRLAALSLVVAATTTASTIAAPPSSDLKASSHQRPSPTKIDISKVTTKGSAVASTGQGSQGNQGTTTDGGVTTDYGHTRRQSGRWGSSRWDWRLNRQKN